MERPTARRSTNRYRDYVEALVQRDVRDITRTRSLDDPPRLLRAVVLFDGEAGIPFGNRFHAVPMSRLWRAP